MNEGFSSLLARLAVEHAAFLYRVAYAVVRRAEDAEDAVQDVFLKLQRTGHLPEMVNERAFLAKAVWRIALDRKTARKPATEDGEAVLQRVADTRATPEHLAAQGDERALLAAWIEDLPPELRETLLLSAVEGMNSREAAEVLGVPEATVRTRLHRARGILRDRWQQMQTRRGRAEVAAAPEGRSLL
ncbi:MAG: sigma-70 family RNA polymerase sigma factor [Acidobacteriaceae bacterium]|nr:sigma-70 family RNA polymerase sigma factor [Acidobacteriaceae bacterium]